MAYMDKKRYKNPTIPSAGRQGTSQPKYDRNAPPPRAPMRAAASMRVASREPREGAPPIPQTRMAPEPETMAAGPVMRAPASEDVASRKEAITGMMTPGTTLAPTTPAPVAAAPALPTAPQPPPPAFDPLYAKSAPPPGSETPDEEGGMAPTAVGYPFMAAQAALDEGVEAVDVPDLADVYVGDKGYYNTQQPPDVADVYGKVSGMADPQAAPTVPFGQDPGSDIKGLIEDLANQGQDSAAQEAALAGKKSEYLEAVDRMVREGALRRMGSGGAFARGFGTITGKYAREMNNTELKQKELDMSGLSTAISNYINLHATELDDETKRLLADWQVHTDKIAQFHAEMNNTLTDTASDKFTGKAYTSMATMWNDYVLAEKINPATDEPWTTHELLAAFFVKHEGQFWWTGHGPDGSYDEDGASEQWLNLTPNEQLTLKQIIAEKAGDNADDEEEE